MLKRLIAHHQSMILPLIRKRSRACRCWNHKWSVFTKMVISTLQASSCCIRPPFPFLSLCIGDNSQYVQCGCSTMLSALFHYSSWDYGTHSMLWSFIVKATPNGMPVSSIMPTSKYHKSSNWSSFIIFSSLHHVLYGRSCCAKFFTIFSSFGRPWQSIQYSLLLHASLSLESPRNGKTSYEN